MNVDDLINYDSIRITDRGGYKIFAFINSMFEVRLDKNKYSDIIRDNGLYELSIINGRTRLNLHKTFFENKL